MKTNSNNTNLKIKVWRKKIKHYMILAMGEKCACCGYNNCQSALELHHILPSSKEISFSKIRTNPKNLDTIIKELKKCILLCANCHREVHSKVRSLPTTIPQVNESLLRMNIRKQNLYDACIICGKAKLKKLKTCSHGCYQKLRIQKTWGNCNLLLLKKRGLNNSQIANLFHVSECSVRKRLKRLLVDPPGLEPGTDTL